MKHRFRLRFIINGDIIINRFISVKSMPKVQPNNVILDFTIGVGNGIISIPRALSLLNRRSYRSGFVYSVDFVEYVGNIGDTIRTACLPFSYPTFNAYKLGFSHWLAQRSRAIEDTGIEPGKWSDFKPWYSLPHLKGSGAGGFSEYYPVGVSDASLNLAELDRQDAEWNMAEMVVNTDGAATTATFNVGMLGDNSIIDSYGSLLEAYGDTTRPTLAPDPLTPGAASGSWITQTGAASAEMSLDTINLIEDENDFPPYANQNDVNLPATYVGNSESAPGGLLMDIGYVGTTGRPISLDGGLCPLGYIAFFTTMTNVEAVGTLRVHVTRGEYKGVAAISMGSFS